MSAAKPNAVVMVADAKLFPAAACAAHRLTALNNRPDTDIYIFTDSAADAEAANSARLPFQVRHLEWPAHTPQAVRFSYFLRFLIPEALGEGTRRIVYLDIDTYVENQALLALFDFDLQGHIFAGVRDYHIVFAGNLPEVRRTLGRGRSTKYLNTGVLVIDRKRYLARKIFQRLQTAALSGRVMLVYPDQSVLNFLLKGDWLELSPSFNMFPQAWESFVRRVYEPVVVHFAGASKPWDGPRFTLPHPARSELAQFIPGSPWPGFLSQFLKIEALTALSSAPQTWNAPRFTYDDSFDDKPDFIRYLRETHFADVEQGLTPPRYEHLPPVPD